ncbi:hypothetical protein DB30_00507 [Enhygromyxa salina]|uniref:Lipoprotein n=1 Tax=Enhygromyxa salina TaxID=215803 RepID=A0A0C1Z664_9BACT|nr:hypothetical protein [Enhygromyxa salina]KIG13129.1 hypothetical protein DB30_00507 [Enhygromyxa salina]
MANLKDIVATLAILSAGTLTLTGCKKEGETTNPDEVEAGDSAGPAEGEGEASCKGDDAEASCSGEDAPADGAGGDEEASCSGESDEASCSGAA